MKPYVLGAIFARGGSKGLARKNVRNLAGKPLIAYAIEAGLKASSIDEVIVSTDDEEIAAVSRKYGAKVPFMRPRELATDDSPELLSWKHAISAMQEQIKKEIDIFVSIPTTSPLREVEDIERCVRRLKKGSADIVITVKKAERNPYFNMVAIDEKACARLLIPGQGSIGSRQQAPAVYDMTTVAYAARASYISKVSSLFEGRVEAEIIPRQRALDIDTLFDFEVAEFLMLKKASNSTGNTERAVKA